MVQYSKIAVILLNTTNRINTQETDVISLHFALRVILNIQKIGNNKFFVYSVKKFPGSEKKFTRFLRKS